MNPLDKVPIMTTLAKEFANFDRYFTGYPGSTSPNRMFLLSGTNYGCTDTGCSGPNGSLTGYPQKTIFDQIEEANRSLTWKAYYSDAIDELSYM